MQTASRPEPIERPHLRYSLKLSVAQRKILELSKNLKITFIHLDHGKADKPPQLFGNQSKEDACRRLTCHYCCARDRHLTWTAQYRITADE